MKNIDRLKQMDSQELANTIVIDSEGHFRSPCGICKAYPNCDDNCIKGVFDYLESESE
jgi:hypothetical protein